MALIYGLASIREVCPRSFSFDPASKYMAPSVYSRFPYLQPLPPAQAEFVVTNVHTLITNDPAVDWEGGVIKDAYILVKNGRFERIGRMDQMPEELKRGIASRAIPTVDGSHAIVSPGMTHCHTHLCQTLWMGQGEGKQLLEWLRDHTWPGEAAMTERDIAMAAHFGAWSVLRHGATTVLDMATVHNTLPYVEDGLIPTGLRVWTGNVVMDKEGGDVPYPARLREQPDAALRKTEETLQRIAELAKHYRVHPAVTMRFLITSEGETARALSHLANKYGWVLQTHASENADEVRLIHQRFGLDNIAALHSLGFLGERTFLHHTVHTSDDEIALMALTGTTAVHCPCSNGMLGSGVMRVRDFLDRGVSVALGSDGAPCNDGLSIREDMKAAKLLAGARFMDSTNLRPAEILDMATIGGARGLGMEGQIGRIKPGYRADFVFWGIDTFVNAVDLEHPRDIVGRLVRTTDTATDVFIESQHVLRDGKPAFLRDVPDFRSTLNAGITDLNARSRAQRVIIPFLEIRPITEILDNIFGTRPAHAKLDDLLSRLNRSLASTFKNHEQQILNPASYALGCLDRRIPSRAMGLGGSGITAAYILGTNENKQGLEAIKAGALKLAPLLAGRVDAITSHADCFACRWIYEQCLTAAEKLQFADSDAMGQWFAAQISSLLQERGHPTQLHHHSAETLNHPIGQHPAQLVFYTGTKYFHIDGLVPTASAFVISRGLLAGLEDKAAATDVGISSLDFVASMVTSNLGSAGVSVEHPCIIVPVGGELLDLKTLHAEAKDVATQFGDKVQVLDGFVLKPPRGTPTGPKARENGNPEQPAADEPSPTDFAPVDDTAGIAVPLVPATHAGTPTALRLATRR